MGATLSQRIYWRILRELGLKEASWDKQYRAGVWCRGPNCPDTVSRVTALCRGGRLVEFGCGEGSLPNLLPRSSFSDYIGYDISPTAIERARQRASLAGLSDCRFEQCDMSKWTGLASISLILAEECLYYLNPPQIGTFLRRCSESLAPGGSILVIVHSGVKHARTLDACRQWCEVKAEEWVGPRAYLTLGPGRGC